jgi:hypothetical protein
VAALRQKRMVMSTLEVVQVEGEFARATPYWLVVPSYCVALDM